MMTKSSYLGLLLRMALSLTFLRSTVSFQSCLRTYSETIRFRGHAGSRRTHRFSTSSPDAAAKFDRQTQLKGDSFFADPSITFQSMGITSPILLSRIESLGLSRPTAVQASSFQAISSGSDVTIGAETGSGKTLAYLLPIMNDILLSKQQHESTKPVPSYDYARALILVPNKELVHQVARMAQRLAGDPFTEEASQLVRLAVMPGGLNEPLDFRPFRESIGLGGTEPPIDLVVSTPASVSTLALKPKHVDMFADIQTLVVDEADMLLDGGYLRQLNDVLMGFRRADRLAAAYASSDEPGDETPASQDPLAVRKTQHIFVAATLPDYGLRSVDAYLSKRFPFAQRVTMKGMHSARHYGLKEKTQWLAMEEKKERLKYLILLLEKPVDQGGLRGEKVMVFLNSVEDVDNVHQALTRSNVSSLPFHAKLKLEQRTAMLDRFRRYNGSKNEDDTVGVLVCTDLASRGLDVPNVDVVVQLQFAGNVVSHLHRMGRCGRAGQRNGRGIVFYGETERELVEVVRRAEEEHDRMVLEQDVDLDDDDDYNENKEPSNIGTVENAFSRKRGFTKKRKKQRRDGE